MKRSLLSAAVLLALCEPVHAQTLYLSPSGSDGNDCSISAPCYEGARCQRALPPNGGACKASPGAYYWTEQLDVQHFRKIALEGDCAMPGNVQVTFAGNGVVVQDHATMSIRCFLIAAPNGIAFLCRQIVICDAQYMAWGAAIIHMAGSQGAEINCGGNQWILGSAQVHADANRSELSLGCAYWIANGVSFIYFVRVGAGSMANFGGASFDGSTSVGGYKGVATTWGSYISTGGVTVPGNDGWYQPSGSGQIQ